MVRRPKGWTALILAVSSFSLLMTLVSYPLAHRGMLSRALFWFGYGGEFNVGSWWSSMLFMLAAAFAAARAHAEAPASAARRGWASLAGALALLSFDEMASLHEYLSARSDLYLVPYGALGLALAGYGLLQLRRSGAPLRTWLVAFSLLATVPVQEYVQSTFTWTNDFVYGFRALVEEGTEIAAALLFVAVTSRAFAASSAGRPHAFAALARRGGPLTSFAAAALAIGIAVGLELQLYGMITWIGASLLLFCALLAAPSAKLRSPAWPLVALYLLGSLALHAVSAQWNPEVLGYSVEVRGLFFALWLCAASWHLSKDPRHHIGWLALAAFTLVGAVALPNSELIWLAWPAVLAWSCFGFEISAARRRPLPAGSTVERPLDINLSNSFPEKPPSLSGPAAP